MKLVGQIKIRSLIFSLNHILSSQVDSLFANINVLENVIGQV